MTDLVTDFDPAYGRAVKAISPRVFTDSSYTISEIVVQIVEIVDVSSGKFELLQKLKSRRGRGTRRVNNNDDNAEGEDGLDDDEAIATRFTASNFHKLVVQDFQGNVCFAFEQKKVPALNMDTMLGTRLKLTNVTSSRGVLLLTPANTQLLPNTGIPAWEQVKKDKLIERVTSLLD